MEPATLPPFEDLGHGITAIDTGYVAPVLRREPPRRRERPGGLRGRGHDPLGARPPRRARGAGPAARGGGLRDRDPRAPRPRGRGRRDDAAAAAGPASSCIPAGRAHMVDPSKLWAGASAVFGEEFVLRSYGAARSRRRVPGRRGAGRLHARAGRPPAPLPRHAGPRTSPRLRLGRGLAVDVHRRHLRPLVPRARERARGLRPARRRPRCSSSRRRSSRRSTGWWPHAPAAMLLTHYSRVVEVERLAADLRRQTRRARGPRPRRGRQARPRRAPAPGVEELFLGWVEDHGTPRPRESVRELLAVDVELNAQGLEVWLDRGRDVP